jgi:hypothetical protein
MMDTTVEKLADDILRGAEAIAEFVYGSADDSRSSGSARCCARGSLRSRIGSPSRRSAAGEWSSDPMLKPKEYEEAVLQRFKTDWPPPRFVVKHTKLPGGKSRTPRQIDIGIFETGEPKPFLIVEVKRRGRSIDVAGAGATIALVRDVGGIPGVMVSTSGFSTAARNYLAAEGIGHLTVTLTEANGLRWIPLVEEKFAVDHAFREVSGHLVEDLRNGDAEPFLNTDLPYEEWLAVMACGQSLFSDATGRVLKTLAQDHADDGVRFNAVMLLDEAGQLTRTDAKKLLSGETDPDILELLRSVSE